MNVAQRRRYTATAIGLHWIVVALIVAAWALGLTLVGRDKALAELLKQVHVVLNWALFVTACIHVAAALKHHFVDRDDVLARMLPFVSPRR